MFSDEMLNMWFCDEVLPLEPSLTAFLRRHWRQPEEIADLRQEVYEKALRGASRTLPDHAAAYVFTIARNLLVTRVKRMRIVQFDLMTDLEGLPAQTDWLTPERHATARQELAHAREGLDALPPRCREVMNLRKVQGLKIREIAEQLGVGIDAVEAQITRGMRLLADHMLSAQYDQPDDGAALNATVRPKRGDG